MLTFPSLRTGSLLLIGTLVAACAAHAPSGAPAAISAAYRPRPLAAAPDQFLTVGDVRLRYRETGRGQPIVLLHGYTRSLEDWIGIGDSLALGNRVIALDLRGFGQSSRFTEPARFGVAMADDVVRLLDALRISRAHLVGHSMGALVAANVAARYPGRVVSASLLAPPTYPDSAAFARTSAGWIADIEGGRGLGSMFAWLFPSWPDGTAADASKETLTRNPPATLSAVLRAMGALTIPAAHAAAAKVPILIAVGTGDPLLGQSRWLGARWRGARLLELPGGDHVIVMTHARVLAAIRLVVDRADLILLPPPRSP